MNLSSLGLAMALGFEQEPMWLTPCYDGRSAPYIDVLGLFVKNMSGKGYHRVAIRKGTCVGASLRKGGIHLQKVLSMTCQGLHDEFRPATPPSWSSITKGETFGTCFGGGRRSWSLSPEWKMDSFVPCLSYTDTGTSST